MKSYQFPPDFLWGTATAAHQVEGNNKNSDWWRWEQSRDKEKRLFPLEPSGLACDSYHRYKEDFDLCQKLNNNAVRFSIEWARIQPKKGIFSQDEIQHYKKVMSVAREKGLKIFVTLHHFTNPTWFADQGGWRSLKSPDYFSQYVKRCAEEFGELVDAFITINEPQVYALMSYTQGIWPPNKKNYLLSLVVQINMVRAHRRAYDAIRKATSKPLVGIAKNIVWYETDRLESRPIDRFAAGALNFLNDDLFLRPVMGKLDFLGLNYYFTARIRNFREDSPVDYVSDLGWWINPGGLGELLKKLGKYNLPIYVTENGLADAKDKYRKKFLQDMILACGQAINDEGVDLRGYFHWSLLDNYEWHQGFWPRFGLVEIDREHNLERKPRRSFYYYAKICKSNRIEI